jgi:hypothetical protein
LGYIHQQVIHAKFEVVLCHALTGAFGCLLNTFIFTERRFAAV